MFPRITAALVLALTLCARAEPATRPDYDGYTRREIRGWTIYVANPLLKEESQLGADALELLDTKLYDVNRVVPKKAVVRLREVPIWLEVDDPKVVGGCYHPSAGWLKQNGMNPGKLKCVEFGSAARLLTWSIDQPNMVLHELSHAYHDRVLGFDNPDILAAYRRAVENKSYDAVLRSNGHVEKAYAKNDPKEYFAELSEAYFGTNDFYPFVRAEVLKHDPGMYEVLKKVWEGEDEKVKR